MQRGCCIGAPPGSGKFVRRNGARTGRFFRCVGLPVLFGREHAVRRRSPVAHPSAKTLERLVLRFVGNQLAAMTDDGR